MRKIISLFGGKLSYVAGLALASLVGGLVSATVLAAIPSNDGTISGCYTQSTGALRVIDTDASQTCTSSESGISWPSSSIAGAQVAHAGFNADSTLNATYSTNITDSKIVTDPEDSGGVDLCFEVGFTPKSSFTPLTSSGAVLSSFGSSQASLVAADCGTGYNAVVNDVGAIDSGEDDATVLSLYNVTFVQ